MQLKSVGLAESMTGGNVSAKIVQIPDASLFFKGSVVAYSDKSKVDILNVSHKTIDEEGVVSAKVALEMALGAKKVFQSDIAFGVTGYAGPKGDNVGLVYVAWVGENHQDCKKLEIKGKSRVEIIDEVTNWMIDKIDRLRFEDENFKRKK